MAAKKKAMKDLTVEELRAESDRLAGEIADIRALRHMIAERIRNMQAISEREGEDDGS